MEPQQIRTELDRVLGSAAFAEAERARKFLRFVVDSALNGRADEIKESVIGVEVLGRPPSFDPRTDPIVRVEAGRLRTRLLSYYQSEGANDPIVIELPKGGYVPKFQERQPTEPAPATAASKKRSGAGLLWTAAAVLAVLICWGFWFYSRRDGVAFRDPVRLSVLAPDGSTLQNSAISPDGRLIVFAARSGKLTRLWIRSLDAMDARPLPGTERAAYPFWSPDGKAIGFFASEKLKKIQISGGPAETICDVQAAFGGSWGTRGIILFAQRPSGVLFQVPAGGRTPSAVTTLERARGEIAHVFPHFLPDGRQFLFSVINRAPAEPSLRTASLDRRGSKMLLSADLGAAYQQPYAGHGGSLLFAYHGALFSQPFNARTATLGGAATQIVPEVRHVGSRADFSVSSNGVLIYQPSSDKDRQLTWFDRSGRDLSGVGPPNDYESFRLATDGQRLAIQAETEGRSEIWTLDLARGSLSRVGSATNEGFAPVWSPNGREILFSAETDSGMILERQPLDELNPISFLEPRGVQIATDWSADGKFVAYSRFLTEPGIWIKSVDTAPQDRGRLFSTGGVECCAAFSPAIADEGPRWVAYSSDESGQDEVYVKTFPTGDRKWQVSTQGGWVPHWRKDGRELFYLALDGKLMALDIGPPSAEDFASGVPKPLFDTGILPYAHPTLPGNSYAISRDGQRILTNRQAKRASSQSITVVLPPH